MLNGLKRCRRAVYTFRMEATKPVSNNQLVKAVVASAIGTAIEWYDFFLYGFAAALVFPQLFFPGSDPLTGALLAFSTYFVGFLARPVGAAIFGHFGDRRKAKARRRSRRDCTGFRWRWSEHNRGGRLSRRARVRR